MKIQLVQPKGFYLAEQDKVFPPLGLLSIATYLKKNISQSEIEILDENLSNVEGRIDADYVGFSTNLWNYKRTLELVQKAKEKNSITILGGPYVTDSNLSKNILEKRKEVDYIIRQDGEEAMLGLLQKKLKQDIPNLAYRNSDIHLNNIVSSDLNDLPHPDRSLINLEDYFNNSVSKKRPITLYSQKGCNHNCIFCFESGNGKKRTRQPEKVWQEIEYLDKNFGPNVIMDTADNISLNWLKRFAETKPSQINSNYHIYARASDINDEFVNLLKRINCNEVAMGFESANKKILEYSHKGSTPGTNQRALELLSKNNVRVSANFIFGLLNETPKTLEENVRLIEKLAEYDNFELNCIPTMTPIPGSKAYSLLISKHKELEKEDLLEPEKLADLWLFEFTSITRNDIKEVYSRINGISKKRYNKEITFYKPEKAITFIKPKKEITFFDSKKAITI